jgi:L-alanine-DL-glutamate epimerase-like enolase superfamily enzyme
MKITAIETIEVQIPFTCGAPMPPFLGMHQSTVGTLLVKVGTDAGFVGWGDAFGHAAIPATRAAIDHMLAPAFLGRDATQIEPLMRELAHRFHIYGRSGPVHFGLSGIDIALWDIAGKRAGLPLCELLGGSDKQWLTAYASLTRYGDPDLVAQNAGRATERGFAYVKLHETGLTEVRAVREAVGGDVRLMLDANCPWSVAEAVAMARRLEEVDLYWLEEPCWPPENYAALAQVRAGSRVATAAGENATSAVSFLHMFEAGAVDYAQPSPAKVGISEARQIVGLAHLHNVALAPHTPYFGPGFLAGLHLNAALRGNALVEWLFYDLEDTLYGDAIVPHSGKIAVPTDPGLGREPDAVVIERYRV